MTGRSDRLYHVALAEEWSAAVAGGTPYRTSTLGLTVDDEGFTHCARAHQVAGVLARFYTGVTEPLVVLELDADRLTSPVVDEVPAGASEAFPHLYGPVDVGAAVGLHPVTTDAGGRHLLPDLLSGASTANGPST